MVRKVVCIVCCLTLVFATAIQASAATYTVYDNGNISNTYITYFKDILSGAEFDDNYVAFRNGQYSYIMIVGDLEYNNGVISSNEICNTYEFSTDGTNYNSQYKYYTDTVSNFTLNTENYILYSDLGNYPQLLERGDKYEILTTFVLCTALLCVVISRIFNRR